MLTIFLLSIAGSIIAAIIGTIWYSPATPMGKLHMKHLGFDKLNKEEKAAKIAEAKPKMPKIYAAQMGLSFLTSLAVVFIITMSMKNGLSFPSALGFVFVNWLCFMVPAVGMGILWSNDDRTIAMKRFFSDIFENLFTILIIAILTSLFV